jgi:hypothetical protein
VEGDRVIVSDEVSLSDVWKLLRDRLSADPRLSAALQGQPSNDVETRVFLNHEVEDTTPPAGDPSTPWARIILMNPATGFDVVQPTGVPRKAGVLVTVESNGDFAAAGYSPQAQHEAIHRHVMRLVKNWDPGATAHAKCYIPFYVYVPFVGEPLWNDPRNVWVSSADFRAEFMNPNSHGL